MAAEIAESGASMCIINVTVENFKVGQIYDWADKRRCRIKIEFYELIRCRWNGEVPFEGNDGHSSGAGLQELNYGRLSIM